MTQGTNVQQRFGGGVLDEELHERYDLDQYDSCVADSLNVMSTNKGELIHRPGTLHKHDTALLAASTKTRLIPFAFSNTEKFLLEFSDSTLKIYQDNAQVTSTTKVTFETDRFDPAGTGAFLFGETHPWNFPYQTGDVFTIGTDSGQTLTLVLDPGAIAVDNDTTTFEIGGQSHAQFGTPSANTFVLSELVVWEEGQTTDLNVKVASSTIPDNVYFEFEKTSWTSPYLEAELDDIQFCQSGDIMFFTHRNHQPMKLSRVGATDFLFHAHDTIQGPWRSTTTYGENWTPSTPGPSSGPYYPGEELLLTPTKRNNKNLDGDSFTNRHIRVGENRDDDYTLNSYCECYTTGVNETNDYLDSVDLMVIHRFTHYQAAAPLPTYNVWGTDVNTMRVGHMFEAARSDGSGGWPRCCAIWENRLIYASSNEFPIGMAASRKGDFDNFAPDDGGLTHENNDPAAPGGDAAPEVRETDGFVYNLNYGDASDITWVVGTPRGLMVASDGGVFISDKSNSQAAFSATNFELILASEQGGTAIQPQYIDGRVFYVGTKRDRIYSLGYDLSTDVYAPVWESIFSDGVVRDGINQMAFCRDPIQVLWLAMDSGALVSMVILKEQDQVGFFKHKLASHYNYHANVESICSLVSDDEPYYDQLYMHVQRPEAQPPSVEALSRYPMDLDLSTWVGLDGAVVSPGVQVEAIQRAATGRIQIDATAHGLSAPDEVVLSGFRGEWAYLNGQSNQIIDLAMTNYFQFPGPDPPNGDTSYEPAWDGIGKFHALSGTVSAEVADNRWSTVTVQEKGIDAVETTDYTINAGGDAIAWLGSDSGYLYAIGHEPTAYVRTLPNIQNNQLGQATGFLASISELVFSVFKSYPFTVTRYGGSLAVPVFPSHTETLGDAVTTYTGKYVITPEQIQGDLDGSFTLNLTGSKPFRLRAIYKRGERATR